jgi:hypothetical protein
MATLNRKELLERYYQHELTKFKLNDDLNLSLPIPSLTVISKLERRFDRYEKSAWGETVKQKSPYPAVKFIKKNGRSAGFVWHTTADKLQEAVRWGVVKTESVTGKVISALGRYRLIAHERILKGTISNTHLLKEKLLAHYQRRCELLQPLESWVNQPVPLSERKNEVEDQKKRFLQTIKNYISDLESERDTFKPQFDRTNLDTYSRKASDRIKKDIQVEIDIAKQYHQKVSDASSLRPFLRAGGNDSVLELVKYQMRRRLYAMQGINQDCTFSRKRRFAATRGELNSCIEDARKEIYDYGADLRNAVTDKHHGIYGKRGQLSQETVAYDFHEEQLTAEGEREALLAISFIEGYDRLDLSNPKKPKLISKGISGSRQLKIIYATYWQVSSSFKNYMKKVGHALLGMVKSIAFSTRPWEKEFQSAAANLRENALSNEPLWYKPKNLLDVFWYNTRDFVKGFFYLLRGLFVEVPSDIANAYAATEPLRYQKNEVEELQGTDGTVERVLHKKGEIVDRDALLRMAEKKLRKIQAKELEDLIAILRVNFDTALNPQGETLRYQLAHLDYHLKTADQNDFLTGGARGIKALVSYISHQIFAKDPTAGAIYTGASFLGLFAVLTPQAFAMVEPYVRLSDVIGKAMGSSQFSAAVANAVTQAQVASLAWNTGVHGPKGWLAQFTEKVSDDPVSLAVYSVAAYWLAYLLANGFDGKTIPGLSDFLKKDLGKVPELSYPFISLKLYLLANELFHSHESDPFKPIPMEVEEALSKNPLLNDKYKEILKFHLIAWLSPRQAEIRGLKPEMLFELERLLAPYLTPEEKASVRTIFYPEKERSIAYQFFAIPLSYIPSIFFFLLAPLVSLVAWMQERENPWVPIRIASAALFNQSVRDLTRLIIFAQEVLTTAVTLIVTPIKMLANMLNLIVNRPLAWLGVSGGGYVFHITISYFHAAYSAVEQWFNPVRTLKSVTVAHPNHTVHVIESTYAQRLEELLKDSPRDQGDYYTVLNRAADKMRQSESKPKRHSGLFSTVHSDATTPSRPGSLSNIPQEDLDLLAAQQQFSATL